MERTSSSGPKRRAYGGRSAEPTLVCATQASLTPWQHPEQAVGSKSLSIPKPGPGSGPWCLPTQTQWPNLVRRRPHGMVIMGGSVDTEGALWSSAQEGGKW